MARRPTTPESSISNMIAGLRREGMLTERSIDFYEEHTKIVLKYLQTLGMPSEPWLITPDQARALLDHWQAKGLAVATRRGYLAALRTWTAYYGNRSIMDMRVIMAVDTRPNADWLTDEQARLLVALPKCELDEIIIHCELCLGMRRIEVLRLKPQDFTGQYVEITGKGPKGGKLRRMPYHRETSRVYAAWMRVRAEICAGCSSVADTLLVHRVGRKAVPYGDTGIDRRVSQLAQTLGFEFSNHTLRRTFGRTMWHSGVPVETVSKMLGHTSIDMTLKYIGADFDDMTAAMRRFTL